MTILDNFQKIQRIINGRGKACLAPTVTIVAVTKGRTPQEIGEAIATGVTVIGENRWQEASLKLAELPPVEKHFIGHLQTNKVKFVVPVFDMIQSVDSLHLAKKIDEECAKIGKTMPILIEVNTSGEPQKTGVALDKILGLIREISVLKNIKIRGLMTLACESDDPEKIRACFRRLKELSEWIAAEKISRVEMDVLSMGMSDDFEIALGEGATMIRIGRGIFED